MTPADPIDIALQSQAMHQAAHPHAAGVRARAAVLALRERDRELGAFTAVLDPDGAAAQAEALSRHGGPLAGVLVGVKDIFDTRDLPTAYGSPIYRAEPARQDAAIVSALRRCGALVVGKTTTTEFAYLHPTATRNPRAPDRTPGGSSAGSAAAVAAGLVPLAIGTQTGGSVIRPASYCGVVGYKPTFGWLPTPGLKCFSWSLDTVGLFTRTVRDMAWAAQALSGRSLAGAITPLDTAEARGGVAVGVPLAYPWGEPSPGMQRAVQRAASELRARGFDVRPVELPPMAAAAFDAHADVQNFEAATALHHEFTHHRDALSPVLRHDLEAALTVTPAAYERGQQVAAEARVSFEAWMARHGLHALLTPSAPGEAPLGLGSTGTSTFNRVWTLLGWPCVSVPGCMGEGGAPLGVQLIGRDGTDARTLQLAEILEGALA
ncbi:MAG: amidase [Ideonella sp.]|jgi:Asp-tRNA(Asn)/Glu-tRNA(Gln) amidotransferase A subunit family amidase|nr:amidase [Ideonella sp.]